MCGANQRIRATENLDSFKPVATSEKVIFSNFPIMSNAKAVPMELRKACETHMAVVAEQRRVNFMEVSSMIMERSAVFNNPESFVNDIDKMKQIMENIGEKLSELSSDAMWNHPTSDPDYDKKHSSGFKNVGLDWVNINPTEQNGFERAGYNYEYKEQINITQHEKKDINFFANGIVKKNN